LYLWPEYLYLYLYLRVRYLYLYLYLWLWYLQHLCFTALVFSLDHIADVGRVNPSRNPKLISHKIIFEVFQPVWQTYLNVTDRQTDGRLIPVVYSMSSPSGKVKWGNFDIGVTLTQVAFCWLLIDRTRSALLLILDSQDCTSGMISNSDATFVVAYINIRLLLFGGRGSFAGFQCDKTFVSWSIPFNLAIRNKSFYSGITMCMLVISCHAFNISDCWISV